MRKAFYILAFISGFFYSFYARGDEVDITKQEAVGKAAIAVASSEEKKTVGVRQVNPTSYEVTTRTPTGTERKIVSVRRTVGSTYEVITHK